MHSLKSGSAMREKYLNRLENDVRILKEAALHKSIYQCELESKTGITYNTGSRCVHELEDLGYLKIFGYEETEAKGKKKKIWEITLKGLINLLYIELDTGFWDGLEDIVHAHKDKLLIFRKWNFFQTKKLDKLIQIVLKNVLEYLAEQHLFLIQYGKKISWTEEELQKLIDSMVLGAYALRTQSLKCLQEQEHYSLIILKACKKDPELHNYILNELHFFKKIAKSRLTSILEGLEFMK